MQAMTELHELLSSAFHSTGEQDPVRIVLQQSDENTQAVCVFSGGNPQTQQAVVNMRVERRPGMTREMLLDLVARLEVYFLQSVAWTLYMNLGYTDYGEVIPREGCYSKPHIRIELFDADD